jgi:hypothetical protein
MGPRTKVDILGTSVLWWAYLHTSRHMGIRLEPMEFEAITARGSTLKAKSWAISRTGLGQGQSWPLYGLIFLHK